ncbi:hypothetical protein GDO78_002187 [Eleutherodactylus coqui]|uniref:Uncharacterized protein n=1 Tax=Eleutherodactylus coqui TaxID=57060 RepID=A0A8J6K293_ELECQ|nr:hypothetical protein GDO78_002187 [Eleutherodactylus coqui]
MHPAYLNGNLCCNLYDADLKSVSQIKKKRKKPCLITCLYGFCIWSPFSVVNLRADLWMRQCNSISDINQQQQATQISDADFH